MCPHQSKEHLQLISKIDKKPLQEKPKEMILQQKTQKQFP